MPPTYTITDQVKFLSDWFDSWSEFQREDFLPILAQSLNLVNDVNGMLPAPSRDPFGRRPSLFDCQVKLFHDWYDSWSSEDRERFLHHINTTDPEFAVKLEKLKTAEPILQPAPQPQVVPPLDDDIDDGVGGGSQGSSPPSSLTPPHSNNDSGLDERQSEEEEAVPPVQELQALQIAED